MQGRYGCGPVERTRRVRLRLRLRLRVRVRVRVRVLATRADAARRSAAESEQRVR